MRRLRLGAMGWGMALLVLGSCTDDTTGTTAGTTGTTATDPSSSGADGTTAVGTTAAATQGSADATGTSTTAGDLTSTGPGPETGTTTSADTDSDTDTDTGELPPRCLVDADCDDMLICSGMETCVAGACVPGIAVVCDDGVPCTLDACDEASGGMCVAFAQDANCDNGIYCDGVEICDPLLDCQPGVPVVCNDAVDCSVDACDEEAGACSFVADHVACQDGQVCNGVEVCDLAIGCQAGPDLDCNDGIGCTSDSCNEGAGGCVNQPVDAVCQNGVLCDGEESCNPAVGCEPGPAVACLDDGFPCTVEACSELALGCETTLNNGLCPGGEFCTTGGCIAGDPCNVDADCNDGVACNGIEVCDLSLGVPGFCAPGAFIDCDDAVPCTIDYCVEPGACANEPFDGLCNDGNVCDGVETCDALLGCEAAAPPVCNDGIACTNDGCDPLTGCFNNPQNFLCQDGSFCNGAEVCNPAAGCQPSPPVNCGSDGIACTTEICDDALGGCTAIPNDDVCPCGESCVPALGGCANACNIATCEGQVWDCGNCLDDDGDCAVDSNDGECFGPCDNSEEVFAGLIPGQNNAPCKADCYFDNDTGSGNDDCFWSLECDPLEPSLDCNYDPNANIPGSPLDCAEAQAMQSQTCDDVCGPLVPNGCDCFGCCEVFLPAGGTVEVYLGTENAGGDATCTMDVVLDPALCAPCTQVQACLNTCSGCEICFGMTEPPPGCVTQECPDEQPACGQPDQAPCPVGAFCLTGCCVAF